MHRIDHFCIGVEHLYEGQFRLRDETGLDAYDGGWFKDIGVAQRTVPLGNDCYIEVESVISHAMAASHPFGRWNEAVLATGGDHLWGWVIAVDSLSELEEVGRRIKQPVQRTWGRIRPDGQRNKGYATPFGKDHAWPRGLPLWQFWEDMEDHPDRIALAKSVNHRVRPRGIAWVEVGDEKGTRQWLGPEASSMDVRYVDGPPGLYGVGIATDEGEIVIRRPPVPTDLAYLVRDGS